MDEPKQPQGDEQRAGAREPSPGERLLRAPRDAAKLAFDAARWGAGAFAGSAVALYSGNAKLLAESSDLIVRSFLGRQIEATLGGQRIRARVKSIQLYPGLRNQARLELTDVRTDDGLSVPSMSVLASEVAVTPPPELALSLSGVEIRGGVSMLELLAWIGRSLPRWRLGVTRDGLIEATSMTGDRRIVLAPKFADGELELELRELGWHRLNVVLPRWMRLRRSPTLPALPDGLVISEATPNGENVDLLLTMTTLKRRLDLFAVLGRGPQRPPPPTRTP